MANAKLQNATANGPAARASFSSSATLTTIPTYAKPEGIFYARHGGNSGVWYIKFNATSVTTSDYSVKLQAGDEYAERNPPKGVVKALHVSADVDLDWHVGWYQGV